MKGPVEPLEPLLEPKIELEPLELPGVPVELLPELP
jgi:hypothetical protein